MDWTGPLRRFERGALKLARRKKLAVFLVGLAPLVIRALLLPIYPIPEPRIHDEFSHLLIADTFAHGRLVNPVHPLWVNFDSMHILVRPVYASIYPAAQGAVMALGQVLTGYPWIGVWLSMGLMCAALCWMLQGWVSPGWALLGGVLIVARFGVLSYWMNSYWGGAVPASAGALVLGALPRLIRRARWQDAAWLAIGLAVLANSRPYEGLVFSLPIIAALAIWILRTKAALPRSSVVAFTLIMGITAAAMGYYFARFTGNPLVMPYQYFRSTFTMAPHFIFQAARREPVYYHQATHDYYAVWEMAGYRDARANRSPHGVFDKAKSYFRFYLGPFLAIPFVAVLWWWKRRRIRFLLLSGLVFAAGLAVEVWNSPHYAAPAMGLMLLLVIEGLRHLRLTAGGIWTVRAICMASILLPVIYGGTRVGDGRERANILKQLEASGENNLAVVRYQPGHDPGDEWVYNSADIDHSRVVWAREMDPESNQKLLHYFAGRRVWLVEPDTKPVRLSRY